MSQKSIRWIIGLMCLSLIGIIAFQAYWIRLSIQEKSDEFDQDIQQVLAEVEEAISNEEAKFFVKEFDFTTSEEALKKGIQWGGKNKFEIITRPNLKKYDSLSIILKEELKESEKALARESKIIINSGDSESEMFIIDVNGQKEQALKLVNRFQQKRNKLDAVINELAFEFAFQESSLEERLSSISMDSLIEKALLKQGLPDLDYQYSIRSVITDSLIVGTEDKLAEKQTYITNIFDKSEEEGVLEFQTINKASFILSSLWLMLTISLILTLIMIFTFAYTLHSIIKQKRMSEVKSDFINNMTHEFKTPIATISLAIDSILLPEVKKKEKEVERLGEIIKKENMRMNDQVEKVLQAAMFEKEEVEFNLEHVHANIVLEELVDSFTMKLNHENSILKVDLAAQQDLIHADRMHFYNSVRNLIDNAIKYSNESVHIEICSWNDAANYYLSIKDHGIGMNAETQKRIFDRFYRQTSGNLHSTKGFGLGLSYVKAVIDQMKAQISVESKPKLGSLFTLTIPLSDEES